MENISVEILASESMGVRSMCTKVKTPDICLMLDPGCALGPRNGHEIPHPREYRALHAMTGNIIEASRDCTALFISHFHHDHFKPRLVDEAYIHSNHEIFKMLYDAKDLYLKSQKHHIGKHQESRSRYFKQSVSSLAGRIVDADARRFEFGDTIVDFSHPASHGELGTKLGTVIMCRVRYKNECFVFAPDVQGPVVPDTVKFILDTPVDLLFIGGPPLYLSTGLARFPFSTAEMLLGKLHDRVPRIVLDHHCCRSEQEYQDFVQRVIESDGSGSSIAGHEIMDAATYTRLEPSFLESKRDALYLSEPPSERFRAWMELPKQARERQTPPVD